MCLYITLFVFIFNIGEPNDPFSVQLICSNVYLFFISIPFIIPYDTDTAFSFPSYSIIYIVSLIYSIFDIFSIIFSSNSK